MLCAASAGADESGDDKIDVACCASRVIGEKGPKNLQPTENTSDLFLFPTHPVTPTRLPSRRHNAAARRLSWTTSDSHTGTHPRD